MKRLGSVLVLLVLSADPALAQSGAEPEQYRALRACRAQADDAARLRCFDAAVSAFEAARAKGDVLVNSRADAAEARRSLFGFAIPRFLRGGGGDDRDEIKELRTTIKAARDSGFMKYSLDLAEGGSWQTIDSHDGAPPPRTGEAVLIKRTPFGSYLIAIPGQKLLRAKRTG